MLAFAFAVLGATLIREAHSKTISCAQMATFGAPLSSQDSQLGNLVKIDKATKEVTCACCKKLFPLQSDLL